MRSIFVSGGFDPLHVGHVSMMAHAAEGGFGKLRVILNSDDWLIRKKGYSFMPWNHRATILCNLRFVDSIIYAKDEDGTVIESLREHGKPGDWFVKGGDRTEENTPEVEVCRELGIEPKFGFGNPMYLDVHSSKLLARKLG